jgi:hypothetical protein
MARVQTASRSLAKSRFVPGLGGHSRFAPRSPYARTFYPRARPVPRASPDPNPIPVPIKKAFVGRFSRARWIGRLDVDAGLRNACAYVYAKRPVDRYRSRYWYPFARLRR